MAGLAGNPAIAFGWRLILVVAGAALVWQVLTMPAPVPSEFDLPEPAARRAPITGDEGEDALAQGGTDYPAISSHPVFFPDRTPWEPPPPEPEPEQEPEPPKPPALDSYSVVGLILSGPQRSALLKRDGGDGTIRVTAGEEFEGWTLEEITQERLRFVAGPNEYEMIFPLHAGRGQ